MPPLLYSYLSNLINKLFELFSLNGPSTHAHTHTHQTLAFKTKTTQIGRMERQTRLSKEIATRFKYRYIGNIIIL